MADDRICVQQTPHPIVQPHPPADDVAPARGAAPARAVGRARGVAPGGPGHYTPPRPAAAEPKLRVPGPATDLKAAERQAEKHTGALAKVEGKPTPAQSSAAERVVVHNATVQYAERELRRTIWEQSGSSRAYADFLESSVRFVHAKEMLYAAAGIPMAAAPGTEAAVERYPDLVIAEGKFYQQVRRLPSSDPKDVERSLTQLKTAATEWRDAWAVASKAPSTADDIKLQNACKTGLALAEGTVEAVTDPQFIKAMKPR